MCCQESWYCLGRTPIVRTYVSYKRGHQPPASGYAESPNRIPSISSSGHHISTSHVAHSFDIRRGRLSWKLPGLFAETKKNRFLCPDTNKTFRLCLLSLLTKKVSSSDGASMWMSVPSMAPFTWGKPALLKNSALIILEFVGHLM